MAPSTEAVAAEGSTAGPGPQRRASRWRAVMGPPGGPRSADPVLTGRALVPLARGVLVLVLGSAAVLVVGGVLASPVPPAAQALALAAVLAQLAVQLRLSLRRPRRSPRACAAALLLQAGLAVLTAAALGTAWPSLSGFVVGGLLLTARRRVALPASAAVVAAVLLVGTVRTPPPDLGLLLLVVVASAVLGLAVAMATRLLQVGTRLLDVRVEVARERARMARDVHDLLGLGLSAIALKCDLALRLLPADAEFARVQLTEVLTLARRALADVRSVSRGVESLSLDDEIALAKDLLMTVNVRVRVHVDRPAPAGPAAPVLAAALREGVTNVLRHSDASHCAIAVVREQERVSLEIVNDGVRTTPAIRSSGQGLRNLRERAAGLGGAVFEGRRGRDYVLRVVLPRPAGSSSARRLTTSPPRGRSGSRPRGSARRVS